MEKTNQILIFGGRLITGKLVEITNEVLCITISKEHKKTPSKKNIPKKEIITKEELPDFNKWESQSIPKIQIKSESKSILESYNTILKTLNKLKLEDEELISNLGKSITKAQDVLTRTNYSRLTSCYKIHRKLTWRIDELSMKVQYNSKWDKILNHIRKNCGKLQHDSQSNEGVVKKNK